MRRWTGALCAVLASLISAASAHGAVRPLPVGEPFDYQLAGGYEPARGVTVVARDRTETPAGLGYDICYINAFQTQPGELGWWRRHHPTLLLRDKGALVIDPDWHGEVLLDIRTRGQRAELARIWRAWIAGCARKGYHAVEPDNLDSWTRSHRLIARRHTVDAARLLVRESHRAGLAAGQKNAVEIARPLRAMGFDFAVVEECEQYRECDLYRRHYGSRILEIEYPDSGGRAVFERACARRGSEISIVYRDRDLAPAGSEGHVEARCIAP